MALVKKDFEKSTTVEKFDTLEEALECFRDSKSCEDREQILEQIAGFENGAVELVKILKEEGISKELSSHIGSLLLNCDPKKAPIEEVMELLKIEDAYLRNLAISILQTYGEEIRYHIVKFLIGEDRDLRIFAINVLGDVNFPESRDMLLELLRDEEDINVAMSAVDYLAEIGTREDVELLQGLKERFNHEPYVVFGVDRAIKMING